MSHDETAHERFASNGFTCSPRFDPRSIDLLRVYPTRNPVLGPWYRAFTSSASYFDLPIVFCAVTVPKSEPSVVRVPLITVPSLRVNIPFSAKGPHVGLPGATWLGSLTLRHRAALPGFA